MTATSMRHDNLRTSQWLSLCTAIAVTGCIGGIDYDDEDTADPTQQNIQQYEQLRMSLEQKRELVLPADAVDDVRAAGPWLTWLDLSQGFSGVLHARRGAGGDEVVSEVPIGDDGTPPNYEISEELAMTAVTVGGDAVYTVLRLGTGTALDQVTMTKPDAAKYDAYGVFSGQAYIVVEAEDLAIYEWTPGTDAPTQIASFGEAGTNFGAWLGFVVAEDMAGTRRLVGVGTLGTHSMDLATKQVTQVPLPIVLQEGAINEHGIAAIDGRDIWWYDWGAAEARAIHDELALSGYLLNSTYAMAHLVGSGFASQDIAIDGTTIYYRSNSGIYAYDVASKQVTPVLLDDLNYSGSGDGPGGFITYTGLAAGDGALVMLGLESTNGATGYDGPTYRVGL